MTPSSDRAVTGLPRRLRALADPLSEGMSDGARLIVLIYAGLDAADTIDSLTERVRAVSEIVDLYFSPWGAAKGAKWESLTGDQPFTPEVAMEMVRAALASHATPERSGGV